MTAAEILLIVIGIISLLQNQKDEKDGTCQSPHFILLFLFFFLVNEIGRYHSIVASFYLVFNTGKL